MTPGRRPAHIAIAASASAQADTMAGMTASMESLQLLLEEETELVRAGRLAEAAELHDRKAAISGDLMAASVKLKAEAVTLSKTRPDAFAAFRERQQDFHALLRLNMAVLATAHAVAEDLIRGATNRAAQQNLLQGYGASGAAPASAPRAAQPVRVSRSC
jgi:hypothetical protein